MTRSLIPILALAALIFTPTLEGKKVKTRNWQTGKLLDVQRSQRFTGTVDRPGWVQSGKRITGDTKQAIYAVQDTFVIEGRALTYTVSEAVAGGAKPANVTVHGPIRFSVEDTTLYLIDEAGKEHRTEIMKKALQTKEPQPAPER
jgi:hypothetical protein